MTGITVGFLIIGVIVVAAVVGPVPARPDPASPDRTDAALRTQLDAALRAYNQTKGRLDAANARQTQLQT